jgi:hypothetical protein
MTLSIKHCFKIDNNFKVEKYHTLNGHSVAVKKAFPKESTSGSSGGGGPSGGRPVSSGGSASGRSRVGNSNDLSETFGDFSGISNMNLGNFALMAQKIFQAAAMQNYGGIYEDSHFSIITYHEAKHKHLFLRRFVDGCWK